MFSAWVVASVAKASLPGMAWSISTKPKLSACGLTLTPSDSVSPGVTAFTRMPYLPTSVASARVTGRITLDGRDIHDRNLDVVLLRAQVGMVFQKPNPFPKSIFENVAYGPRLHGLASHRSDLEQIVESSLRKAGLWDEVKDRLDAPGTGLSGGQQQRLCIARAIAVSPDVILMDEPCSALDPIATGIIEDLITELKRNYTIVIVTHNMQQAGRVADRTAFFHLGHLVEIGATSQIFMNPRERRTEDYVTGRYG